MEDFTFRRDLINAPTLLQLNSKSDQAGLTRISIHVLLIVACGILVWLAQDNWWIVPAWILYGNVLVFLFSPLHECIHRTAFRTRNLNNWVATIAGFVILLPANYFRYFHFEHHRYTNDPDRDPELLTDKPQSKFQYLWAMTGLTSYWLPQIRLLVLHSFGKIEAKFIPESAHRLIKIEARAHLVLYAVLAAISIYFESDFIIVFWIVPILIGMIGLRMFLLAEHGSCELSPNMLVNTRTTLTRPLMKLISWNMPFHCEHHLYPSVPFHNLPQLHEHVKDRLGRVSPGYLNFHSEYFRSL